MNERKRQGTVKGRKGRKRREKIMNDSRWEEE